MLCEKLFLNIVSNPHHKLAEPAENRNSYNLRHNRKFNVKRTKTNRYILNPILNPILTVYI